MSKLNKIEVKKFRKEIKNLTCNFPECDEKVIGLIRTHGVCKKHFRRLKKENKMLIKKGIEIGDVL